MSTAIDKLQIFVTTQPLEPADAVVWLQGDRWDRANNVLNCYKIKVTNKIVIAGNNVLVGKGPRVGEDNISLQDMEEWLLGKNINQTDIITLDKAMHTADQAKYVIDLAKQKEWESIIIVGSTHHQVRPFLTFLKYAEYIGWNGKIINKPAEIKPNQIPSGRSQTMMEIFIDECDKIDTYAEHVMKPSSALSIINNSPYDYHPSS